MVKHIKHPKPDQKAEEKLKHSQSFADLFTCFPVDPDGLVADSYVKQALDGWSLRMLEEVDTNKDGKVSGPEWVKFWDNVLDTMGSRTLGTLINVLTSRLKQIYPNTDLFQHDTTNNDLSPRNTVLATQLFDLVDSDGDGKLIKDEMIKTLPAWGFVPDGSAQHDVAWSHGVLNR